MSYQVNLIREAEDDLFEIYEYIFRHDSKASADYVLDELENLCESLANMPHRGHLPPELSRINVTHYLEVHFKPYRVIYEIEGRSIFIHCVLDGRRDIGELLTRRLIR